MVSEEFDSQSFEKRERSSSPDSAFLRAASKPAGIAIFILRSKGRSGVGLGEPAPSPQPYHVYIVKCPIIRTFFNCICSMKKSKEGFSSLAELSSLTRLAKRKHMG